MYELGGGGGGVLSFLSLVEYFGPLGVAEVLLESHTVLLNIANNKYYPPVDKK